MIFENSKNIEDILIRHVGEDIFIFGAGATGQYVYESLRRFGCKPVLWVDNNRCGSTLDGIPVISVFDLLYEAEGRKILLFLALSQKRDMDEVKKQLFELGELPNMTAVDLCLGELYAPVDYLDPSLGYNRCCDVVPGTKINMPACYGEPYITVAVLGGSTSDWSFGGYRAWPEIFSAMCAGDGLNVKVINAAVAGYFSSQEMQHFLRDILPLSPDIVVSMNGVNDMRMTRFDGHPFYHPYTKQVMDTLAVGGSGINSSIAGVTYGLEDNSGSFDVWLRNKRIIQTVCREFGIFYLAFLQPCTEEIRRKYSDFITQAANSGVTDIANLLNDGADDYFDQVHYTEAGNEKIARFVYEKLKPMLKKD